VQLFSDYLGKRGGSCVLLPVAGYAPDRKGFRPVTEAVLLIPEGSVAEQWRKKTEGNPTDPSSPGKQLLKLIWW